MHGKADEVGVKARGWIAGVELAMRVPTRLWLAGVVSQRRDSALADSLLQQVRRCCQKLCELLICTDGWAPYPNSIRRAFREKLKRTAGRGRCALVVWPDLHIGTVIKRTVKKHLKEVIRQMTHGSFAQALKLLDRSKGGTMLNTSFIERLNGTMRERLAALTRKCRHASSKLHALHTGMYLIGGTYNFCWPHHELSKSVEKGGFGMPCPAAMASGLHHRFCTQSGPRGYQMTPHPLPIPKRRGRPRIKPLPDPTVPKQPGGRPRKRALCSSTS